MVYADAMKFYKSVEKSGLYFRCINFTPPPTSASQILDNAMMTLTLDVFKNIPPHSQNSTESFLTIHFSFTCNSQHSPVDKDGVG